MAHFFCHRAEQKVYKYRHYLLTIQCLHNVCTVFSNLTVREQLGMKVFVLLLAFVVLCSCAPAPEPAPGPKPAPVPTPKANPGLLFPASPAIITSPLVSYSHYFKSPLYPTYQPYVYNLGYASGYSYNAYPYYVPLHLI